MNPVFITITTTGAIYISSDVTFSGSGTVLAQFRVNPLTVSQLLCTLTGSGNSSASTLAVSNGVSKKSGKSEGNEVH